MRGSGAGMAPERRGGCRPPAATRMPSDPFESITWSCRTVVGIHEPPRPGTPRWAWSAVWTVDRDRQRPVRWRALERAHPDRRRRQLGEQRRSARQLRRAGDGGRDGDRLDGTGTGLRHPDRRHEEPDERRHERRGLTGSAYQSVGVGRGPASTAVPSTGRRSRRHRRSVPCGPRTAFGPGCIPRLHASHDARRRRARGRGITRHRSRSVPARTRPAMMPRPCGPPWVPLARADLPSNALVSRGDSLGGLSAGGGRYEGESDRQADR